MVELFEWGVWTFGMKDIKGTIWNDISYNTYHR